MKTPLDHLTIPIEEIFSSIQGEGPRTGQRTVFIRTSGCHIGCIFCDTKYSWVRQEAKRKTFVEIGDTIYRHVDEGIGRSANLCLTGGEPLELDELADLREYLLLRFGNICCEVETSGIKPPSCLGRSDYTYFNYCPKLPGQCPAPEQTWEHIDAYARHPRSILKMVLTPTQVELDKMFELAAKFPAERVWLMPLGMTAEELKKNSQEIWTLAVRNGYNFSPRAHIWVWGAARGV